MATVGASHQPFNVPLRQVLEGPPQGLKDGGGPLLPLSAGSPEKQRQHAPPSEVYTHRSNAGKFLELTYVEAAGQQQKAAAAEDAAGYGKLVGGEGLRMTCCFKVTRWHLLVFFCTHALFVGPHYLNWAPLRQCLLYWNAYGWLCEPDILPQAEGTPQPDDTAFSFLGSRDVASSSIDSLVTPASTGEASGGSLSSFSSSASEGAGEGVGVGESAERTMHYPSSCKAQEVAIARLFAITTASDFGVSFIGGLLLDACGPKAASTLGTLSMLLGCILIGVSSVSVCLYIAGFVFYGLGVDAAFYGVISLPMLFPGHEGLTMTVLMSFRCLAWGTPVILERLASPDTLGLSAVSVMLGVQATTLFIAVFISLIFIPKAPFSRTQKSPLQATAPAGGPLWTTLHGCENSDRLSTSGMLQQQKLAGDAFSEAADETTAAAAAGAAAAAAAAAGVAVPPQAFMGSSIPEDSKDVQEQPQPELRAVDDAIDQLASRSLNTMPSFSSLGSSAQRRSNDGRSAGAAPGPGGPCAADSHQQQQQQHLEGEKCPNMTGKVCSSDVPPSSPLAVSPSLSAGLNSWQAAGPAAPSQKACMSERLRVGLKPPLGGMAGLHAFGVEACEFVKAYVFSAAFLPMVPYFALTLLRGVFFGESSEYLVPQAMKGLHILLGLVFVYPPVLGLIADRAGEGLCLVLVNTLGTLLVGLSLLQRHLQQTGVAYLICFCYAAYAPLMSGQIYLYILKAFPQEHLGKLLGLAMTVGGFFSLVATPLFEVSVHRSTNFDIVLGVLLALSFMAYGLIYYALRAAARTRSLCGVPATNLSNAAAA